jgi:uncharacterized RDD family membrane protein YckC
MKTCPDCGTTVENYILGCSCGHKFASASAEEDASKFFTVSETGITLKRASLGDRLVAQIIDALMSFLLVLVAAPLSSASASLSWVGILLFLGYYLFCDGLPHGQSLGKRLIKIRVVNEMTGAPCSMWGSFLRNVTQVLGILDWIWIFGRKQKRGGDMLAHTEVVTL